MNIEERQGLSSGPWALGPPKVYIYNKSRPAKEPEKGEASYQHTYSPERRLCEDQACYYDIYLKIKLHFHNLLFLLSSAL